MASLKTLTEKQLKTILVNAKAEITRRECVQAAATEINAVLHKYKISIDDIDLKSLVSGSKRKTTGKDKRPAGAADKRRRVKAKYQNLTREKSWSGRGRAPRWVIEICQKDGLDIEAFKKDERFLVK